MYPSAIFHYSAAINGASPALDGVLRSNVVNFILLMIKKFVFDELSIANIIYNLKKKEEADVHLITYFNIVQFVKNLK